MRRVKDGKEYWVFPGGTVEEGETPHEAAVREIWEETSIHVSVETQPFYTMKEYVPVEKEHVFYICTYVSGMPQLQPDSPEILRVRAGEQVYDPCWVPLKNIHTLTLYPYEVRDLVIERFLNQ